MLKSSGAPSATPSSVNGPSPITRDPRFQEALAISEERLRLVTEASTDGVWDRNVITGESYWSDRMYDLLGISRDGPRHFHTNLDIVHPDDRAAFQEALDRALASGGPTLSVEVRLRRAPDGYGSFRVTGKVVRDASGAAVRIAGSISDITEPASKPSGGPARFR